MMSKYLVDTKLSHLSEIQIDSLVSRYYQGEKIASLLAEFNIQCLPNAFPRMLPSIIFDDQKCPACGSAMLSKMQSRTRNYRTWNVLYCGSCGHTNSSLCRCNYCVELKNDAEADRQALLDALIHDYCASFAIPQWREAKNLSFRAAVALLAFVRTCESNGEGSYGCIGESPIPYAPEGRLGKDLLVMLSNDELIRPSENSPRNVFGFEDGEVVSIQLNQVEWRANFSNPAILISEIERFGLDGNWPEDWRNEVEGVRLELALAECREFYAYCLSERNLPYVAGATIDNMLINLLRDYSVAQFYKIIWSGAQSTSDFKARNHANSRHAANYMVGACQRWADRARSEGWAVSAFRRNFDLPRSMLSYVLYDVMLKIGEKGFTEPIYSAWS